MNLEGGSASLAEILIQIRDADPEAALDRLRGPAHLRARRPPRRDEVRDGRHRGRQRRRPRRHLEHAAAALDQGALLDYFSISWPERRYVT